MCFSTLGEGSAISFLVRLVSGAATVVYWGITGDSQKISQLVLCLRNWKFLYSFNLSSLCFECTSTNLMSQELLMLSCKLAWPTLTVRPLCRRGFNMLSRFSSDQRKTAFVTESGKWQFTRMPFGLKRAPAAFQREMDSLFQACPNILAYINDVAIFSSSWSQHLGCSNGTKCLAQANISM